MDMPESCRCRVQASLGLEFRSLWDCVVGIRVEFRASLGLGLGLRVWGLGLRAGGVALEQNRNPHSGDHQREHNAEGPPHELEHVADDNGVHQGSGSAGLRGLGREQGLG